MLYFLLERSLSEQSLEDQKSKHRSQHVLMEKKPIVPKPAVDICYYGIYHLPEFGDKCNRCRVRSRLRSNYSNCQIYLCLQKKRNCFEQFYD